MGKIKDYILLHLNIMLFSFTSVFSKLASVQFNKKGIWSIWLYVFLFLMLLNCFVYALAWQKVIRRFELNVAYANRTVYLIWSQVWAVMIFHENLTARNILGLLIVFVGVMIVSTQGSEARKEGRA
ncbi:MAG TPA: EamA-like transporter family protein [Candidatus Blautia intestinigallinarum]|nr:EamA-like transporter family protein [Candidatus Blautia intestinigallinarum]